MEKDRLSGMTGKHNQGLAGDLVILEEFDYMHVYIIMF